MPDPSAYDDGGPAPPLARDVLATLDVTATPRDVVALGGVLDAATLAAAYRAGCFPWPVPAEEERSLDRQLRGLVRRGVVPVLPGPDRLVPWCSPDPRAVLLADQVRVSRSLRQRLRRSGWEASVDAAFEDVVAGCADRDSTWITPRVRAAYAQLHREGPVDGVRACSVEVWEGDALVGGLYGLLVGEVFCGESMFSRRTDASKVALVALCDRLLEAGVRVVDTQQETEHLASLGQVLVRRAEFVAALRVLRDRPAVLARDRRPVAPLAERRG